MEWRRVKHIWRYSGTYVLLTSPVGWGMRNGNESEDANGNGNGNGNGV